MSNFAHQTPLYQNFQHKSQWQLKDLPHYNSSLTTRTLHGPTYKRRTIVIYNQNTINQPGNHMHKKFDLVIKSTRKHSRQQ